MQEKVKGSKEVQGEVWSEKEERGCSVDKEVGHHLQFLIQRGRSTSNLNTVPFVFPSSQDDAECLNIFKVEALLAFFESNTEKATEMSKVGRKFSKRPLKRKFLSKENFF